MQVKEVVEANMKIREPKLSDNYLLLLHYPNQYEYVFNRTFAYPNTKPMPYLLIVAYKRVKFFIRLLQILYKL